MIGILLIYFIGKTFYTLAEKHHKQKWGFAILGVVTYYGSQFLAGVLIALGHLHGYWSIDNVPDIAINLMALPVGILSAVILYQLLKRNWSRNEAVENPDLEILDEDLLK